MVQERLTLLTRLPEHLPITGILVMAQIPPKHLQPIHIAVSATIMFRLQQMDRVVVEQILKVLMFNNYGIAKRNMNAFVY